ncbi:MAG: serine--tRNA ligase, partial [Crocinitomicaceae bacterium]|nr:serine--tRNA ligase [Crocinitomicaceae bacterium]
MLELSRIRTDQAQIITALAKRNINAESTINELLTLDAQWRGIKQELDRTLEESNSIAKEIGQCYKEGRIQEGNDLKQQTTVLKQQELSLKSSADALELEIQQLLYKIPNTPTDEVIQGKNPDDNQLVFEHGVIPEFNFEAKPHWDLCKEKEIIDFELGVKVTGAGFPFYRGKGSKLQRALISFFLDEASAAGYVEYQAPLMVNEASGIGTGQLPDKEGQMYHDATDNLYLIPTAEVPLTNIFRDELIQHPNFSYKLCGYTPCFRREAGSYGKDVRGLNRLHQFDKVEIVRIEHPEHSAKALNEMVEHVKGLLEKLELPYRVLRLCGGDMGFASAMTYDFEVYSAAQQKWLEVSSVSRFDTFQANRLKLRFKDHDKKTRLCHTLNGSALALPRVMAALLENHQDADGRITIPAALHSY